MQVNTISICFMRRLVDENQINLLRILLIRSKKCAPWFLYYNNQTYPNKVSLNVRQPRYWNRGRKDRKKKKINVWERFRGQMKQKSTYFNLMISNKFGVLMAKRTWGWDVEYKQLNMAVDGNVMVWTCMGSNNIGEPHFIDEIKKIESQCSWKKIGCHHSNTWEEKLCFNMSPVQNIILKDIFWISKR